MSEEQMNNYRLTSMEEAGDERMAQIMREVAGIEAASHEARARVEETLNKLRNSDK